MFAQKNQPYENIKSMNPIFTSHLFPTLDTLLLDLLKSLSSSEWNLPTIVPRWKIKDIVAHLLDGNIRAISIMRDQYFGEKPEQIHSYQDLVAYLNRLNADWVTAMQRVSPQILVEMLEITGKEFCECINALPPFERAIFGVAWAGEQESANWFHIAREYTEKWHHQQQIRLAVGQEQVLYSKEFYFPYLETSIRALPHHYREINAKPETVIHFQITGEGGGDWYLVNQDKKWFLSEIPDKQPIACSVEIAGEIAWRIFTKGISKENAKEKIQMSGSVSLGEHILSMLAVMA